MNNMIYETRREAQDQAHGNAVCQVEGGYIVCGWDEFRRRITEEAQALQAGGWTSEDTDELMGSMNFDEEHADVICKELAELENA